MSYVRSLKVMTLMKVNESVSDWMFESFTNNPYLLVAD